MKKYYYIVVVLLVIGAGCICMYKTKSEEWISGNSSYYLSEKEILEYNEKALNSEAEAAKRLGDYYVMYCNNIQKALDYYKIGADNNDASCQYDYAYYLLALKQDSFYEEAVIYLKLAASNGNTYAKKKLSELGIVY